MNKFSLIFEFYLIICLIIVSCKLSVLQDSYPDPGLRRASAQGSRVRAWRGIKTFRNFTAAIYRNLFVHIA